VNQNDLKSGNNAVIKNQGDWNVETITEQIFGDLNGAITRSEIQEILKKVIPKYESARIQIYVPIFIRRDTINELKSMQTPFTTPDMATNEADKELDLETSGAATDVASGRREHAEENSVTARFTVSIKAQ